MSASVTNYDGSITTTPQQLVQPQTVAELQEILRNRERYPGPVRAKGSYHSLTPCVSTPGTIVDMKALNAIVSIDPQNLTFTAQAGLEMIEANRALREQKLQFILNIEIGNMTLGSAACCHTKDALDGVGFGQVNSYITGIKWVSPSGTLEEASETRNPELLPLVRASYGLAGIVYEVTFKIKPLEIVRFNYHVHDVASLTQEQVSDAIASNDSMVCWTVGRKVVFQTRNRATELRKEFLSEARRFGWSFLAAFTGRAIRQHSVPGLTNVVENVGSDIELGFYELLSATGGFTLYNPDKMIDYSQTQPSARYAFTFWAFPRNEWVKNLNDYVAFADRYFAIHGFRCNLPLGSYFIRQDRSSLLSYTYDGDVISLDPIHAPGGDADLAKWQAFLREFNAWAAARGGKPLLNQSPFVTKQQVIAAYGDRWTKLAGWLRTVDPDRRMVNEFFADLLV